MTSFVLKLGENITLSIVQNKQLIYHLLVANLADLPMYTNGIEIDEMILLVQGTVSSELKDNSYRLSTFRKNNTVTHFIMPDRDLVFLTELCNSNGIKDLYIHSYLDYICSKFMRESKVIVVDNYLDKYVAMYLEYGEIKELYRTPSSKLSETISRLKSEFDAPVRNCKTTLDGVKNLSAITNYTRVDKRYQFSIDHLAYCLTTIKKSFIANSDITSLNVMWSGCDDQPIDDTDKFEQEFNAIRNDAITKQNRVTYKNPKSAVIAKTNEPLTVKASDLVVNVILGFIILTVLLGFYMNVVFTGKVKILSANNNLLKLRYDDVSSVGSSKNSEAPTEVKELYLTTQKAKISNVTYESGELSVVSLSEKEEDKEANKKVIENKYKVVDKAFLGNYTLNGASYEKTKFILGTP